MDAEHVRQAAPLEAGRSFLGLLRRPLVIESEQADDEHHRLALSAARIEQRKRPRAKAKA